MPFIMNLKKQVPLICQEKWGWGGAAVCQMAMAGYPPGAKSCSPKSISQTTIWNHIQAHNKEPGYDPKWGYGWSADPYAIANALNHFCPPQHKWIDVSGANKQTVLYTLLRYIAKYKYPGLVCTFGHDYWVTVVYFKTSGNPTKVSTPTLKRIGFYGVGTLYSYYTCNYHEVDGSVWLNGAEYWKYGCGQKISNMPEPQCGKIWGGKWVAIAEPPDEDGQIRVAKISRTGKRVIGARSAAKIARDFLSERGREESADALGRFADLIAGEPMLVRELPVNPEERAEDRNEAPRFYVIPFASRHELDPAGQPLTQLSVLVNAYTGSFEQLCVFSEPVRYTSQDEAVRLAAKSLDLATRNIGQVQAELVFDPLQAHGSSALPDWRITAKQRTMLVTQDRVIVQGIHPLTYKGS